MNIHRPFSLLFLITMTAGLLTAATDLAAGPLKVKSADPNSGVVGETHIVTIKGVGFTNAKKVRFLVNKSNSDTGNVQVTELTEVDDETLTVKVDLDGATVADYDIEVQLSGGRKGKGTTLFRVQSKDGGGTGSTLTAVFCLNMPPTGSGLSLASDGKRAPNGVDDYCDDKSQRVMILTHSHPGFRFDSNSKSRPPRRWVQVDVPDGPVTVTDDDDMVLSTFNTGDYQIDLRFNKGNGGLDLGGMELHSDEGGPEYFVPVNVWLDSLDGYNNSFGLAYSTNTEPLNDGRLADNTCIDGTNTLDAQVKRLSLGSWSIESNPDNATACLWDLNADLFNQTTGTLVQMPFFVLIEIE